MKRWQYGIADVPKGGEVRREIVPVADEAEARRLVAEQWPLLQMYRRPPPKPWRLVPFAPDGGSRRA